MEISTPGRICLFGEHQDYLGLPVIAMAISLRMSIKGQKRSDRLVKIDMPNLNEKKTLCLDNINYEQCSNYFESGIKVCKNEGLNFSNGFNCKIDSQIPIAAGTSSSSALNVNWINFLSKIADNPVEWDQKKIAEMAFKSEVEEFNGSGGMMDQYSTSIGNLIYLESTPKIKLKKINANLGSFVLGDSLEFKNTQDVLKRCRKIQKLVLKKFYDYNCEFDLFENNENLDFSILNSSEKVILEGIFENKKILESAFFELTKNNLNKKIIGELLLKHHQILRDVLKVSTKKIDLMLDEAIKAGALGGKINGSGGGGCMFAYAPDDPDKVVEAINKVGGKAYLVFSDNGTIKVKGK